MRKHFAMVAAMMGLALTAGSAEARLFTYVYEPKLESPGELEFEQWITARVAKENSDFTAWDFREEIEYGISDRWLTALYLNFSHTDDGGDASWDFDGVSSEWIYLLRPMKLNPFGLAVYGELTVSDKVYELEEKLILGQRYSTWAWALNATVEQEWEEEGDETEKEGVLEFSGGVSRFVNERWSVGLEARHTQVFEDFTDQLASGTFLGPSVRFRGDHIQSTLTILPQIYGDGDGAKDNLQLDEFERVEIRLITAFEY